MGHGAGTVEDNEDEVAGPGDGDNLPTSTLVVLGSLDDSREIEKLHLGSLELENARDAGQGCELVLRGSRLGAGEHGQQGRLPDRGEPD